MNMSYYSMVQPRIKGKKNRKKKAEIIHSSRRCLRRYNIQLTDELRSQIISAIKKHKPTATLIDKESNRVSKWEIRLEGYPKMRVVYDRRRKEIVTVL
jgi:hypothetical protein